jgi:hypothetical protein
MPKYPGKIIKQNAIVTVTLQGQSLYTVYTHNTLRLSTSNEDHALKAYDQLTENIDAYLNFK